MPSHFLFAINQVSLLNAIYLLATKHKTTPNGRYLKKNDLHILHLNINSLLPKIDEIHFIAKQSNASITGISNSKLDLSILNTELDG